MYTKYIYMASKNNPKVVMIYKSANRQSKTVCFTFARSRKSRADGHKSYIQRSTA